MAEQKSNTWVIILVVAGGVLVAVVALIGVFAVLGISGMRGYLKEAKSTEGRAEVRTLASDVAMCADRDATHALPASSRPVPADLRQVAGKKYMSSPGDWSDPAFSCGHFSMSAPQYFQYRWEKDSDTSGHAEASADLDGDGKPEIVFRAPVTCTSSTCTAGAVTETH